MRLVLAVFVALAAGCPPPPRGGPVDGGLSVTLPDAGPFVPPGDGGVDDGGFDIPLDAGTVNSAVTVTAIVPAAGPVSGLKPNGEAFRVKIEGADFTPAVRVLFDDVEADNALFLSDSTIPNLISVHPNCASVGRKTVTVYDELGVGQLELSYTCFAPIDITGVTPDHGSTEGGDVVVISGSGFTAPMLVTVGGRAVVGLDVTGDGSATFLTPPGTPGRIDVVATDTLSRNVDRLSYRYIAPLAIASVTPNIVDDNFPAAGATVELRGAGYVDDVAASIGAVTAPRENLIDDERLRVVVPSGLAGAQDVAVQTVDVDGVVDDAVLAGGLVVRPAVTGALVVTAAVPAEADAAGGTVVTLVGEQFTGATSVTVAGAAVAFVVVDDRTITFTAPATLAGPGAAQIRVTTAAGTASLDAFAYAAPVHVTGVSPGDGPASGGTVVTIAGRGFVDPAAVTFGGIPVDPADVVVVSDSEISAVTPAGAAGLVDVAVTLSGAAASAAGSNGARGVEENAFRFDQPVSILGVIPARGSVAGFTFVTVTGSGFSKGAASVTFGGVPAVDVNVVSDSVITCRTPPAGSADLVDVVVTVGVEPSPNDQGVKAFAYYLGGSFGGAHGGAIDGEINVTVLDANTARGVPGMFTFIGTDGQPAAGGITNTFGQATISGPDVVGPQTVTIAGDCFSTVTFFDINASDLTAFVFSLCAGPPGPPPPPPPQVEPTRVKGHVFGFAKEFFDPAAIDQSGCAPDQGPPAKCEVALAEVSTTTAGVLSRNPPLLPDSIVDVFHEGDPFFLDNTRSSNLALVAIAAIVDTNNHTFRFRQLGVRRAVFPRHGVELDDQDIELTIPLDVDVDLSLPDAPIRPIDDTLDIGFVPTITRAVPFLQFGGEGAFFYTQAVDGKQNQTLHAMPDVPGALLTFIAGAYTTDGRNLITDVGTVTLTHGDRRVIGSGTTWTLDADNNGSADVEGNVFVTDGPNGRFASVVQGAPDNQTLQLQDPPDFDVTTPQAYHVGKPGPPSSEVMQDGVGDLSGGITIQPVLGVPKPLSPLEGSVLVDRTLRWKAAPGQQPSIHDMLLFEASGFATIWEFYVDGLRTKVIVPKIPDLEAIERALPAPAAACVADPTVSPLCGIVFGLDPSGHKPYVPPGDMARGAITWQHEAVFTPGNVNEGGFRFDDWSLDEIGSRGRRSWTTDNHLFVHGEDGDGLAP